MLLAAFGAAAGVPGGCCGDGGCLSGHRFIGRDFFVNTPDWLIRLITVGRDLALVLGQICQNAFVEHIFCFLDFVGGGCL